MATDRAIRVRMDISNLASTKPMEIVRRVLQVLEPETVVITADQASYVAGSQVYNEQIDVGTIGTPDYGIAILVDSTVTPDKWAQIKMRVALTLDSESITNTTGVYSANADSKNQVVLTVT
ncbi:hypothetical protein LCGC14_2186880 [marine sediment metagenome]|uniref:Uncharacterized protein n=1 Tax=marine sediment metagenome TaxID=412755 RepID=A0A0F9FY58_9ZZZZ